jgi:hypothetical protein
VQQKAETRQQRAWKRSRHGRTRHVAAQAGSSQCLLCVLSALLLAAIVATCTLMRFHLHAAKRADNDSRFGTGDNIDGHHRHFPYLVHTRDPIGHHRLCTHGRPAILLLSQLSNTPKSLHPPSNTDKTSPTPAQSSSNRPPTRHADTV